MKNILLSFDEMGSKKDAATRAISAAFKKAGAGVVQAEVAQGIKRTSGITYREMLLTFADSQTVALMVKQTGDIYQIKLNGKIMPIKNQEDHQEAAKEISLKMDAGRSAFQKKLASTKTELPKGIRTAAPKLEQVLSEKNTQLDEDISKVKREILELEAA